MNDFPSSPKKNKTSTDKIDASSNQFFYLNNQNESGKKIGKMKSKTQQLKDTIFLKNSPLSAIYLQKKRMNAFVKTYKKQFIVTTFTVGAIFILFIIAIIAPPYFQKSNALSTFQVGNYEESLTLFKDYLSTRPDDNEASYYAALAALYTHNAKHVKYADSILTHLYAENLLLEIVDLPYYYALAKINNPELAIDALNSFITKYPNHVQARLLRGIITGKQESSFRKAREDFLHADDLVRKASGDFSLLSQLYRYLQLSKYLSLTFRVPKKDIHFFTEESAPSQRLGFDIGDDGFISHYQLSSGSDFANDQLSPTTIVLLLFSHVLLSQGKIVEATRELKEARFANLNSPSVKQIIAFLHALRGDHKKAAITFGDLAKQIPNDVDTLNNHAVASWLQQPTINNIPMVIDLFDRVLKVSKTNDFALNNHAFLNILNNDNKQATKIINPIKDKQIAQVQLNRGILAFSSNQLSQALTLFSMVSEKTIPNINMYLAQVHRDQGQFRQAINLYQQQKNYDNATLAIKIADAWIDSLNWRVAFNSLKESVRRYPDNPYLIYRLGQLALMLDETDTFNTQYDALIAQGQESYSLSQGLSGHQQKKTNNIEIAIYHFAQAIKKAPPSLKREFVIAWAPLVIEEKTTEVINTIEPLLARFFDPQLAALLAYAKIKQNTLSADAIELSRRALNYKPPSVITQNYAGVALFVDEQQRQYALEQIQKARQQEPFNLSILYSLLDLYQQLGNDERVDDINKVIDYLKKIRAGEVFLSKIAYSLNVPLKLSEQAQLAISKKSNQITEGVLKSYQKLIEKAKSKNKAQILRSRASFYAYVERYKEAHSDFIAAADIGFTNTEMEIYYQLFNSEMLVKAKLFDKAKDVLTKLSNLIGDTPLYHRLQARISYKMGNSEKAIQTLKQSLLKYPVDTPSYYELAKILRENKQLDEATDVIKKLLQVDPDYSNAYKLMAEIHNAQGDLILANQYLSIHNQINHKVKTSTSP